MNAGRVLTVVSVAVLALVPFGAAPAGASIRPAWNGSSGNHGGGPAAAPASSSPAALLNVLVLPGEVTGGDTTTVRAQLTGAAPAGGVTVGLSSSKPSLAPVPPRVFIPAGSFSTPVTITTGAVTAVTTVTITASLGGSKQTAQLQIDPVRTLLSVSLNPASADGTNGSAGTVTVSGPAPPNGILVALRSSNPSAASLARDAQIQSGSSAGTFTITTADVTAPTAVRITVTLNGAARSATLTVNPPAAPAPALQAVTVSPGRVAGGGSVTGTATLNTAAPAGGAVVRLASSNSGAAGVPASVTVLAGATSAAFTVATFRQNPTTTVAIGGTYGGVARAALLGVTGRRGGSVLPPPPSGRHGILIEPFAFDPTPEGDQTGAYQITLGGTLNAFTTSTESGRLPPGFMLGSLHPTTAVIKGVPVTQGLFAFVIKFTLSSGTVFAWPFLWQITPPAPIVISQVNLAAGAVGQAYDGGFFFGGGVPPYTWSIFAGALPPGLSINTSTSEISGTPAKAGSYSFTARITDSEGTFLDSPQAIAISP